MKIRIVEVKYVLEWNKQEKVRGGEDKVTKEGEIFGTKVSNFNSAN